MGPPSDVEIEQARELQQVYAGRGTDVFPPVDPAAPCPEGVPDGDSQVVVYRVRRGCLWSQRADEDWIREDHDADIDRYFDSDPFVVAAHNSGHPWFFTGQIMPYLAVSLLVHGDEYRCYREVFDVPQGPNMDRWAVLNARYRRSDVVEVPFFPKFPWYRDVPECPVWVSAAPEHLLWGLPDSAEAARARDMQESFIGRSPDEWPPLPEAPSVCPTSRETCGYYALNAPRPSVTVFRHRGGCLVAEAAPAVPDLPAVVGPWDVYDYASDPWAVWACIEGSGDVALVGCDSELPHNARMAELSAAHSARARLIEPLESR